MREILCKHFLSASNNCNPYRGCTHGCIYCDSRSVCYQILDFDNVEVKVNAPEVLDAELSKKRRPCLVHTGSMCDPYLPLEKELLLTRRILEVVEKHRCGVGLLTKSTLALRDLELLVKIHAGYRAVVAYTLTTAEDDLCRVLEPGVAVTRERVAALAAFADAGLDTGVWMTPLLPFVNDTPENVRRIVDMCAGAHVKYIVTYGFGTTMRAGSREYFYACLDRYFPGLKRRYIETFGDSYECPSPRSGELAAAFSDCCEKCGILYRPEDIRAFLNGQPGGGNRDKQLSLFD